jgi:hypothetical protein
VKIVAFFEKGYPVHRLLVDHIRLPIDEVQMWDKPENGMTKLCLLNPA